MAKSQEKKLEEIDLFFQEKIFGWMIGDLRKSVEAETNFLTALGCLTYTEAIGSFLPPLLGMTESGSPEEKRFYRCFFRLRSSEVLQELDQAMRKETNKQNGGVYQQLRHSGAHSYFFTIRRYLEGGEHEYIPVVIARDGTTPSGKRSAPMGVTEIDEFQGQIFGISTANYVDELEDACRFFYQKICIERSPEWVTSGVRGIDYLLRGKIA